MKMIHFPRDSQTLLSFCINKNTKFKFFLKKMSPTMSNLSYL